MLLLEFLRTGGSNSLRSATLTEAAYSPRECVGIKPNSGSDFSSTSGLPLGRARLSFSERPINLRSSGLGGVDPVLEISTFRRVYEFKRKEVLQLLSDRREYPIAILLSGFESSRPSQAVRRSPSFPRDANMAGNSGVCVFDLVHALSARLS
jgi:hypothetical protein